MVFCYGSFGFPSFHLKLVKSTCTDGFIKPLECSGTLFVYIFNGLFCWGASLRDPKLFRPTLTLTCSPGPSLSTTLSEMGKACLVGNIPECPQAHRLWTLISECSGSLGKVISWLQMSGGGNTQFETNIKRV